MYGDNHKKNDKFMNDSNNSSSLISPKVRIKYFTCTRGKDHEGEVLNYVCIKKDCDKRGLLCSICKTDHTNHLTLPLKVLLGKLQKHKQKPLESSQGFQTQLSQLQQIHKAMLFNLKTCVQNLAEKFRQVQTQINEEFGKAKIQLLERVQINMKFNSFIEQALNNKFENRQSFIQDIARISGMIDVKQENKESKQKQSDIKFSANFDLVVKTFKKMETTVSQNLQKIQKFAIGLIFPKYEQIKNTNDKKDKKVKQKKSTQQIIKPLSIAAFSPDYKSTTISLEEGNKVARQTKTGDGRFVFTSILAKGLNQKVTFKIKTLKNWIGLGVAIRQKLKFLNFRFEYNNLGHGSYLISSNGYSWSHTEQSNNIAIVNFKFAQGDIVQLEYQQNKLIFFNKTNSNKHQLKIAFNEVEEKDVYYCANLCTEGDTVQIVEITS